MITRDALYDFTESLITGSDPEDPLYGAESFRNLRGSVDDAQKVVRIDVLEGEMCLTAEPIREELNVRFTAQFWVTPEGDELTDLDDATDESFDMARQFFRAMATDPGLSGGVCDSDASVFETGDANLGTIKRGVTYLDGTINQAS